MATRTLNVVIAGDSKGFDKSTKQAEKSLDRLSKSGSKSLSHLKTGMLAVGAVAAGGLVVGLKKSADAAIEAEKANARLQAQLKASGISYKEHEAQIQRVIDKHSQLSGFDDEDLGDSFTNIVRIVGDVNKALDLNTIAMDFARAKHVDVAKAGELVGKVAGGNVGILSRYGLKFEEVTKAQDALKASTDDATDKQIAAAKAADLQATKQGALGLLQEKFAGQAKAYGETTAGAQDRARVALENLGETIGARVTPIIADVAEGFSKFVRQMTLGEGPGGRVRKVLEGIGEQAVVLGGQIRDLVGWFRRHKTTTDVLISVVAGLTAAFVAYKIAAIAAAIATRALSAATALLTIAMRANPIGIVVTVLIALGAALVTAYTRSATFRRIVQGAWGGVKSAATSAWNVIRPVLKGIADGATDVYNAMKKVAGVFSSVTGAVGDAASFLNPFGDGLGKVAGDISGLGGTGGLMGADSDLAPFAGIGARYGLHVSSGIRPGAITSSGNQSYHSSGDAIDMAGSSGGMMGFFNFARKNMGGRLRELIYTPGGIGIKDGKPYQYSGQVAADHYDHVHVAYTGPFGDGIGQATQAAKAAGFKGQALINAVAIAGAESNYVAGVQNLKYPDHSIGMWQINQLAHKGRYGTDAQLKDPFRNAKAAFAISGGGKNFGPWSTWPGKAQGYLARARAAIQGGGGGTSTGGGGGGGGASGAKPEPRFGPNAPMDYETRLGRVAVTQAKARAKDNLPLLVMSLIGERQQKAMRLRRVRKLLRGRRTKATRKALLAEEAQLIGDIDELTGDIKEFKADLAGGAQSITQAEAMEAGVAADTGEGGGGAAGGGEAAAPDPNIAILADLTAQMVANQNRLIHLTEVQGPQILAAVIAAVNGSIGGSLGLGGFQAVGTPGQLARY